jgi:hypothetical protein
MAAAALRLASGAHLAHTRQLVLCLLLLPFGAPPQYAGELLLVDIQQACGAALL